MTRRSLPSWISLPDRFFIRNESAEGNGALHSLDFSSSKISELPLRKWYGLTVPCSKTCQAVSRVFQFLRSHSGNHAASEPLRSDRSELHRTTIANARTTDSTWETTDYPKNPKDFPYTAIYCNLPSREPYAFLSFAWTGCLSQDCIQFSPGWLYYRHPNPLKS